MTLRSTLKKLDTRPGPLVVGAILPDDPVMVKAEYALASAYGLGALREPPDLDEIADRLRDQIRKGDGSFKRRDLRYAPQCIWGGSSPFAEDQELLTALLEHLVQASRRALTRTLAAVYFRMYRTDIPGLELVGRALQSLMSEEMGPLYDLHRRYNVFDCDAGPERVAKACLGVGKGPYKFLSVFGLTGQALLKGFGAEVYDNGMRKIHRDLARRPNIVRVHDALRWTDEPEHESFVGANKILVNTLLLAFSAREPEQKIKDAILEAVLDRVGDPRTRSQNWVQMPEAAEIARRWLTGLALRQFLEIVDDTAYSQHWDYRRAFWLAFYEKGMIQEAWVAFGPDGAWKARQVFGKSSSFGRLTLARKQVESGHAVLLMRIGSYVVCDWSHNGRCIIWPDSDSKAPRLYQPTYNSGSLAPREAPRGGMEKSHHGTQSYSWQRAVAGFIRDKTGFSINSRDFVVGR